MDKAYNDTPHKSDKGLGGLAAQVFFSTFQEKNTEIHKST